MSGYVGIPTSYTPVEYIESTGTQYIDTGFSPNSNTKVEIRCTVYDNSTTEWFFNGRDFSGTTPVNCFGFVKLSNQFRDDYSALGTNTTYTFSTNTPYKVVQDKNLCYINDTLVYTSSTTTFSTTDTMNLLAARGSDKTMGGFSKGKIYYCKIWDNGTLVRDFIPAVDNFNVACLYEQVEGKPYYNKGTGTFTAGSTTGQPVSTSGRARRIIKGYVGVKSTYTPVEYIGSSGTQYIDTGFKHNQNTRIVAKFEIDNYNAWAFLFGSCGGANAYPRKLLGVDISDTGKFGSYYGFWYETYNMNALGIHEFDFNKNIHTIDNETKTATSQTFQSQFNDLIFGVTNYTGGISISPDTLKLYYFKIYDNDVLVRDFIPVLDGNNVACLWDKVEQKAYYNAGTGTFTAGNATGEPDIEVSKARRIRKGYVGVNATLYTPVDYLESTGTQYIDTHIVPKSAIRFVADMSLTDLTITNRCGWGASGGAEAMGFGLGDGSQANFFGVCASSNNYIQTATKDMNRHIFDVSNAGIKLDNVSYATGNIGNTAEAGQTIYLFGYHAEWETSGVQLAKHRVYSSQIYDNGVLVRDFIPVLDGNNVACLLERVENKFYYNEGTGTFSYGTASTPVTEDVARLIFSGFPEYSATVTLSSDHTAFTMVTHTADYIIVAGGSAMDGTPKATVSAISEDGVITSAPSLPTQAANGTAVYVGGYGMAIAGVAGSSWSNRTSQAIAYANDLTRTTCSNASATYESAGAWNSSKACIACGFEYYNSSTAVMFYDTNLTKTNGTASSGYRGGKGAAAIGDYIVLCGSTSSITPTDFYDASNVKTTSTNPYNKNCFYNLGLNLKEHAVFFGGATSDNVNNAFADCVAYDSNKVKTSFTAPVNLFKARGFSCNDNTQVWVGFNSKTNSWVYDDSLVLQGTVDTPNNMGYDNTPGSDSNDKFGLYLPAWVGTVNATIMTF